MIPESRKRFINLLCILSLLAGLLGAIIVARSFSDENVWRKDYLGDYLTGRAILLNENPYLPLSELAIRQGYSLPHGAFLHPNPHSPLLAVLSVPPASLPYRSAAVMILLMEIVCLLLSVAGIAKWAGEKFHPLLICAIVWASLGWGAVWEDLALGQTNLAVLALLITGLLWLREEKQIAAGIAIGGAVTLKLIFWPLLIMLVPYRKLKALSAAVGAAVVLHMASFAFLGYGAVAYYYRYAGPTVADYHRAYSRNMSFWSLGWRFFDGTGSPVLAGITMPPLLEVHWIAPIFSYGLMIILFCCSAVLAAKVKNMEAAYSIMICFSLLMSPICWSHYLVFMAIPVSFIAFVLRGLPARRTGMIALFLSCLPLAVPGPIVAEMERQCLESGIFGQPWIVTAVSLIPMYGVVSCALLCYYFRISNTAPDTGRRAS